MTHCYKDVVGMVKRGFENPFRARRTDRGWQPELPFDNTPTVVPNRDWKPEWVGAWRNIPRLNKREIESYKADARRVSTPSYQNGIKMQSYMSGPKWSPLTWAAHTLNGMNRAVNAAAEFVSGRELPGYGDYKAGLMHGANYDEQTRQQQ